MLVWLPACVLACLHECVVASLHACVLVGLRACLPSCPRAFVLAFPCPHARVLTCLFLACLLVFLRADVRECALACLGACGSVRGSAVPRRAGRHGAVRCDTVRYFFTCCAYGACNACGACGLCPLRCGRSLGRGLGCGRGCGRGGGRGRGRRHGFGRGRSERRCGASRHTAPSRIAHHRESPGPAAPRRAPPHHAAAVPPGPHPVGPPQACPRHVTQRGATPRPNAAQRRGCNWRQAVPHAAPAGAQSCTSAHKQLAART